VAAQWARDWEKNGCVTIRNNGARAIILCRFKAHPELSITSLKKERPMSSLRVLAIAMCAALWCGGPAWGQNLNLSVVRNPGGGGWGETRGCFATTPDDSAFDAGDDWDSMFGFVSSTAIVISGENAATATSYREGSHTVAVGEASLSPQINVAAINMTSGLGPNWFASVAGDTGAGGNFEVQPHPTNPAVTTGIVSGWLITDTSCAGGGAATTSASIALPNGFTANLDSGSSGNGFSLTTLVINGQLVYLGQNSGATVVVEFPVGIGDDIIAGTGEDGGASATSDSSIGPSFGDTNCSGHVSFTIEALDPNAPIPLARALKMVWEPETEQWVVDSVLWEESPPE
jgi:hypothetical protein